jgi:phospholipid/cholesterol/gamma-HCH transport system permease protein
LSSSERAVSDRTPQRGGFVDSLGGWLVRKIQDLLYGTGFFFRVLVESLLFFRKRQAGFSVLVLQIFFTGVQALGIITLTSLGIGAVIIIQGNTLLPQLGQGNLIYQILIVIITRELGPVLTAFVVIARSSTAMATELGGMVVSHQIEAYVSVGIDPISYLVVPRFLGAVFAMLALTVYFNFIGLVGAYFVAQFFTKIPIAEYFSNLVLTLSVVDIVSSMLKAFVFGSILGTVACYQGFNVKLSSNEVPVVAIRAVGQGFVLIIVADAIITIMYRI